jgi:hypothetical protein
MDFYDGFDPYESQYMPQQQMGFDNQFMGGQMGFDGQMMGMGVSGEIRGALMPDYSTPPDFDRNFTGLGFSVAEVRLCQNLLGQMMYNFGKAKFTTKFLMDCGYSMETAKRLCLLYAVAKGDRLIEERLERSKVRRQLYTKHKITIANVPVTTVSDIPKFCVVDNIPDGNFAIYNSSEYAEIGDPYEMLYEVLSHGATRVRVKTRRRPQIAVHGSKEIEGVVKITDGPDADGNVIVEFANDYVRLCNRYAIVVSTRRPEHYLYGIELDLPDGSIMYVFTRMITGPSKLKYKGASERVLDWGIFGNEILERNNAVAHEIHQLLMGAEAHIMQATLTFALLYGDSPDSECAAEEGESDEAALPAE